MGRSPFGDEGRDGPQVPPREVGEVVRALLSERRMHRGVVLGRLVRRWDDVVGGKLAAETVPAGFEGGELLVATSSSAWAAQVRFLAEEVRRRANEVLGTDEVRGVRVIVRGSRNGR